MANSEQPSKRETAKDPEKSRLEIEFCGQHLRNPLFLASGIITQPESLVKAAEAGVAVVTSKTTTVEERKGNPPPRVIYSPGKHYVLNAVGLRNPGINQAVEILSEVQDIIRKIGAKMNFSIAGFKMEELEILARKAKELKPDFVELNLSCPNVESEHGLAWATDANLTASATKMVKRIIVDIPLIVKLTPNVTDIKKSALAAYESGADAINAINTILGMDIDLKTGKPMLGNIKGGVSGPAIFPVALARVWDIYQVMPEPKIPILGTGGIGSGGEALKMMMAGASAVSVGSVFYERNYLAFSEILSEMKLFLTASNLTLSDVIGLSHRV